jgi:hypothetical protein
MCARETTVGSGSVRTSESASSRWCEEEDEVRSLLSEEDFYDYVARSEEPFELSSACHQPPACISSNAHPALPTATMVPTVSAVGAVSAVPSMAMYVPMIFAMVPNQTAPSPVKATVAEPKMQEPQEKKKPKQEPKSKKKGKASKAQSVESTTIVIRHLPTDFDRDAVQNLLDSSGFRSHYDFLYLPKDFNTSKNFGYVIINFSAVCQAEAARAHFDGARLGEATFSAEKSKSHTGLKSLLQRYKSSPVMDPSIPDEYKPMLLCRGQRIAFPA